MGSEMCIRDSKDGEDTLFLTFEEGDTIQVESEESDFDSVYLMEWED